MDNRIAIIINKETKEELRITYEDLLKYSNGNESFAGLKEKYNSIKGESKCQKTTL